jgi:hypothetical protein
LFSLFVIPEHRQRLRAKRGAVATNPEIQKPMLNLWIPGLRQGAHPGMTKDLSMDNELRDRLAIRDLIENWVVWRDAGDWERFRSV